MRGSPGQDIHSSLEYWHSNISSGKSTSVSVLNGFSIYMWFVSLNLISVAIVSTLSRACVIFVAPLSVLFLKERLPWTKICSLVLVLIGVILVGVGSYYTADERFSVLRRSEGIATMLLSAFLFACYQVTLKRTIGNISSFFSYSV